MNAEFLEAVTFVTVDLTSIGPCKHFTFDDLGMEQGGGGN
jgi:hypothetical protein